MDLTDSRYIELYSKDRLDEYNSFQEHEDNFELIQSITGKIGRIEVILRNKIDTILSQDNPKWLVGEEIRINKDKVIITEDIFIDSNTLKINGNNYKKSQIISWQSLGFWFKLAEKKAIFDKLFSESLLNQDLKRFYIGNTNQAYNKKEYEYRNQILKAKNTLGLLVLLRNRAFHWENLFKMQKNEIKPNKYEIKPRLTAKNRVGKRYLSTYLHHNNITRFLGEILEDLKSSK